MHVGTASIVRLLSSVVAAVVWSGAVQAQVPEAIANDSAPVASPASLPVQPGTPVPLTEQDLAAFLDGMLPSSMAIGDIAGVTVSVVKDEALLLTKAYGFADVEKRIPVSAERTLFRPASISKLFTWTAVMQQVEAGRLDLDQDINEYLDFKITGFGGAPIKLRHVMTHTAGFEESLLDLLIDDPSGVKPLAQAIKGAIPKRIYPPGAVPAYSNYGASLGGYIVERVSGMPFAEYVEQHIFQPLRMQRSTFRQPVPDELIKDVSNSYLSASGKTVPFEFGSDAPAGALSSTAVDMAQFMLAHLNNGLLPGADESGRILKPETAQLMHSVANRPGPEVDAMAYGFYEQSRNGVRVIAHGGDLTAFHSELVLIPSAKVGLFVSFNSLGKESATYKLRTALFEAFMDRYFPRQQALAPPITGPESKQRTAALEGPYKLSRRAETSLFSFFYMFGQQSVTMNEDGTFQLGGLDGLNDQPRRFQEITPWLWRETAGEMRIAAVRDDSGAVASLVPDGYGPVFVFQPVPAWRDKTWLQPVLLGSGLVLALALLVRLVGFIRRRWRRAPANVPVDASTSRLSLAAVVSGSLFVAMVLMMLTMFSGESFWIISSDARWLLRLVQLTALLAVLGSSAAVVAAARSWRSPAAAVRLSIGRSVLAAACLAWAYVAIVFHFLALRLSY